MRYLFLVLIVVGCATQVGAAPPPDKPLTQRDWMVNLVDGLGLSFGLPENPGDDDYLRILSGKRQLRIEAEDSHQQTDMVSFNAFKNYGPFSGRGWLNGISMPTSAHLRFILPLAGHYRLRAAVRNAGHQIHLGGQTFTITEKGDRFHSVDVGEVDLTAGPQEVQIDFPPNTSVDYIELSALPLRPIAPRDGWQLDRPLTRDDLAVCAAKLLRLEALLPASGERQILEAELIATPGDLERTDIRHLGRPSGDSWLRAGAGGAEATLALPATAPTVYDLVLRAVSETPLTVRFDDGSTLQAQSAPYLVDSYLTTRQMPGTPVNLTLPLGPRAGIDALILNGRKSSAEDFQRLAGLAGATPPGAVEINRLLALLALLQPTTD